MSRVLILLAIIAMCLHIKDLNDMNKREKAFMEKCLLQHSEKSCNRRLRE